MKMIKNFYLNLEKLPSGQYIRTRTLESIPFWIAASIAAGLAAGYATIFTAIETATVELYHHHPLWLFGITPACFFLSWYSVRRFSPQAIGSGIPQLIASLEMDPVRDENWLDKLLGLKMAIVKFFSSMVAALGGGIIGREGPTLHISGAVFYLVRKWIPNGKKVSHSSMMVAGAAARRCGRFQHSSRRNRLRRRGNGQSASDDISHVGPSSGSRCRSHRAMAGGNLSLSWFPTASNRAGIFSRRLRSRRHLDGSCRRILREDHAGPCGLVATTNASARSAPDLRDWTCLRGSRATGGRASTRIRQTHAFVFALSRRDPAPLFWKPRDATLAASCLTLSEGRAAFSHPRSQPAQPSVRSFNR